MFPLIVAHAVFWSILLVGGAELGLRRSALFLLLWFAGYAGSRYLLVNGSLAFVSYVAVLDIILVVVVFKGDLPLR
jgi:hypothetical protein